MKTTLSVIFAGLVCFSVQAQKNTAMAPKIMTEDTEEAPPPMPTQRIYPETPGEPLPPAAPVAAPVVTSSPVVATPTATPFVYDQRLWGSVAPLVTQQEAQIIVDNFRSNYAKLGSPRILIYVNRSLVDDHSGLKLSSRTEQVETTRTWNGSPDATNVTPTVTTHATANNTYSDNGTTGAPPLADRQTVRDVERLIGGPLRDAGATLVDQAAAVQLLGDRPLDSITAGNEQARKDRETIGKIADVALEVLISSRQVKVTEVGGDQTYSVPDIQMTAIRLSDAKVLGQASAADVMNKAGGPSVTARNFGVEAVTQATALSLMEDMTVEAK